ncbi:MAG: ABC transporter permease [Armatimonadota bacterium]
MTRYIISRLLRALLVTLGLTFAVFLVVKASGDPVRIMLPPYATVQDELEMRQALGLDRPWVTQYLTFLSRITRGDFGRSIHYRQAALPLVLQHVPATLQLATTALVIALVIGIPLGVAGAIREGTFIDGAAITLGVIGRSVPDFWLGVMLILLFSVTLRWLPTSGRGGVTHLILPGITLATGFIAQIVLLVRTGMLDVLREDYIRTARAKGLSARVVHYRHAFRNALIPVLTLVGLRFGSLLGGAVITEAVFAWPGVGMVAAAAVFARDFPLVSAAVVVLSIWIVLANLIVDIAYAFIDPRISYRTGK